MKVCQLCVLGLLPIILLLTGCGEQQSAKPERAEQAAPPEPEVYEPPEPKVVEKTLGTVQINPWPSVEDTQVEVIVVPQVDAEMQRQIILQGRLLEQYLVDDNPPQDPLLTREGVQELEQQLKALKAEFPDKSGADASLRALIDKYRKLTDAITIYNQVESLNTIAEAMKKDFPELQAEVDSRTTNRLEAQVRVEWLSQYYQYFQGFQELLERYDALRLRSLEAADAGAPITFLSFQERQAPLLEAHLYKVSLATGLADETGRFEAEGIGELIARVDTPKGPVFLIDNPAYRVPRVRFSEVEVVRETHTEPGDSAQDGNEAAP